MRVTALISPANESEICSVVHALSGTVTVVRHWGQAVSELAGETAPTALIVDADRLAHGGQGVLFALHRRGLLVPTHLYVPDQSNDALRLAWGVPRDVVFPVFSWIELHHGLANSRRTDFLLSVAEFLITKLPARGALAALLLLLAGNPASRAWTAARLAQELRFSRTRLYDELRTQQSPSLEALQSLFRLLPAARLLQHGGTAMDAAYRTGYSDESSLRKAIRGRLHVTVGELRQRVDHRWIVERWLACWLALSSEQPQ